MKKAPSSSLTTSSWRPSGTQLPSSRQRIPLPLRFRAADWPGSPGLPRRAYGYEPEAQVPVGINEYPLEALERWDPQDQGREVRYHHHPTDRGADRSRPQKAAEAPEEEHEAPLCPQEREVSAQWAQRPPQPPGQIF